MKLFLDSANTADVQEAFYHFLVSGLTTNPALVAKEPPNALGYYGHLRDIVKIIGPDTPISIQPAISDLINGPREHIGIIKGKLQSRQLIIKIAMSWDNLPLIRLAAQTGPVNVTCVFTAEQAIAALSAGAKYISFFWGRMNDAKLGHAAVAVRMVRDMIDKSNVRAEIICGSIRSPADAMAAFAAGAHIVTTGLPVLKQMANFELSTASAEGFEKARKLWDEASQKLSDQVISEQLSPELSTVNG